MEKSNYDKSVHSKAKLGSILLAPVLPMMPVACQLKIYTAHYRLPGGGYVSGSLPTPAPGRWKIVQAALSAIAPDEPSYSGSNSLYRPLGLQPAADGRSCDLVAGAVVVGRVYIDPDAVIVSTDESLSQQVEEGEDPDTDGDDENGN